MAKPSRKSRFLGAGNYTVPDNGEEMLEWTFLHITLSGVF
jgi:hypothetical protein